MRSLASIDGLDSVIPYGIDFDVRLYADVERSYSAYKSVMGEPRRAPVGFMMKLYMLNWEERHLLCQIMYGMPVSGTALRRTSMRWSRIKGVIGGGRFRLPDGSAPLRTFRPRVGVWYIFSPCVLGTGQRSMSVRSRGAACVLGSGVKTGYAWVADPYMLGIQSDKSYSATWGRSIRRIRSYGVPYSMGISEESGATIGLKGFADIIERYYLSRFGSMEAYMWHCVYELRSSSNVYDDAVSNCPELSGMPRDQFSRRMIMLFPLKQYYFSTPRATNGIKNHRGYALTYEGREWLDGWLRINHLQYFDRIRKWLEQYGHKYDEVPLIKRVREAAKRRPRQTPHYVKEGGTPAVGVRKNEWSLLRGRDRRAIEKGFR